MVVECVESPCTLKDFFLDDLNTVLKLEIKTKSWLESLDTFRDKLSENCQFISATSKPSIELAKWEGHKSSKYLLKSKIYRMLKYKTYSSLILNNERKNLLS